MKQVIINVSKHNIRYGKPQYGNNCIVQRAIRDAIPLADTVAVGVDQYAMKCMEGRVHTAPVPTSVFKFIIRTLWVYKILPPPLRWILLKPFSFKLMVPDRFIAVEPTRPPQSSLPVRRSIPIESNESPGTLRSPTSDRPDEVLSR